jgi:hypothetical protein
MEVCRESRVYSYLGDKLTGMNEFLPHFTAFEVSVSFFLRQNFYISVG